MLELLSIMRIEAWMQVKVPRHRLPPPLRVPRPGDEAPTKAEVRVVTPAEFARMAVTG